MQDTKLGDIYMQMITESGKEGTVNTKVKAGDGYEGSEKANIKAVQSPDPTEAEGIKQKKPVEGPSADTKAGEPKPLGKKEQGVKDSVEMPLMTFDQLYNKTITEADEEVVPAPDIEGSEFNTDEGDFTGEEGMEDGTEEEGDEIDVASELRLLADRLSEIADKISVESPSEELEGPVEENPEGMEGTEIPEVARESKQVTEAIVSEPTPKPAKKTTLGPKMSQNPKNKIGKSGASKASVPAAGKDRTGTLSPAPKTQFGPKMSQNPSGTGPAVKGSNAPLVN